MDENLLSVQSQLALEIQVSTMIKIIEKERSNMNFFVPEYDVNRILRKHIPIEDAINAGKDSELYMIVDETYRRVKYHYELYDFSILFPAKTGEIWKDAITKKG